MSISQSFKSQLMLTKARILFFIVFIISSSSTFAQVGIGTLTPSSKLEVIGAGTTSATTALKVGSASNTILTVRNDGLVEISSTKQGFLPPRMTAAQRDAIPSPPQGLTLYCTDCGTNGELQIFNGLSYTNFIGGTSQGSTSPPSLGSQRGNDIDGEAASDESGTSVSLSSDGTVLAIGAPKNNAGGTSRGHVRVYTWNGSTWVRRGSDIDGGTDNEQSGESISLSSNGSVIAIGAYLCQINSAGQNATTAGRVRVYAWNGISWTQRGDDFSGPTSHWALGQSVSLSSDGNVLAIGASGNNLSTTNKSGLVRVYSWSGTAWAQRGSDILGESTDDFFGFSVSLSANGNVLAIGAPRTGATDAGQVTVYDWAGFTWAQRGLSIIGEAASDQSGQSVSLSADGTVLAIGAPYNDATGYDLGHVRVYAWNSTNLSWTKRGSDIDGEAFTNNNAGASVSLSSDGTVLAIGAPGNNSSRGHVRLYYWNATNWVQVGNDIDGEAGFDKSGYSVSLSADGTILAIGAPVNSSSRGHVRTFIIAR